MKIMGNTNRAHKIMRKVAMMFLTLCMVVPYFSMLTYAASGRIMFTDPSTKVGETVAVKGVLEADASIEDRRILMSYDTDMLKFKEGEDVTETSAGALRYEVTSGDVSTNGRVEFMMYFDVLKEGTAKIEVTDYKAWTSGANYEEISCDKGSSTITIAAGEGAVDEPTDNPTDEPGDVSDSTSMVEVAGVLYTLTSEFKESDIPEGFEQTTMEYDGNQYNVVTDGQSGVTLGYLVDAGNSGDFFLYVEENATFAPYIQISISDTTDIILLSDVEGIQLPEQYVLSNVTVNGYEFPAWQDSENSEFCILYAVNSNGAEALYQFDFSESTYQKFIAPEMDADSKNDSFIGKLSEMLEEHLDKVILVTGIGFIFFVVLIIILSVKLYNRNAELDEIYEEYGLDLEEESLEVVKETKKSTKKSNQKEEFIRIDDETEDDIVIDEEKDEVRKAESFDVEEDFRIDLTDVMEDDSPEVTDTVSEEDEFFDDDEDLDFEMDFIDLDD